MIGLGSPLAFPLGGPGVTSGYPWITNLTPTDQDTGIQLLKPVYLTVRDSETCIDPSLVRVKIGYASVWSDGTTLFDRLPRTKRFCLTTGTPVDSSIAIVSSSVKFTMTSATDQNSVYVTSVDSGPGYKSAMVSAIIEPNTVTEINTSTQTLGGAILGIEHGPRGRAIYCRFQEDLSNNKWARITSYLQSDGSAPVLNTLIVWDWTGFNRYTWVWNEAEGYVELYGGDSTTTIRLYRAAITSVPSMPAGYYAQGGGAGDVSAIYGQTGPTGDSSSWSNIAITTNVGYPVIGNIRPGDFITSMDSAQFVHADGSEDPRSAVKVPWFDAPTELFPSRDPSAFGAVNNDGQFAMSKITTGDTFAIYRVEPGILESSSEGFCLQATVSAINTQEDNVATGTGITIYDGTTVFQLMLFNDFANPTIGLLKKNGSDNDITEYFVPSTNIDWSMGQSFRFVVDPRRSTIRMYSSNDYGVSLLSITFDRATLPSGADKSWTNLAPFIAFGHTTTTNSTGTFYLTDLDLTHIYQAWDSEDGLLPTDGGTSPTFTEASSGGASSFLDGDGNFTIVSPTGGLDKLHRAADFAVNRGGAMEARLKITSWRPRTRTGVYLFLDDGLHAFALTFVDNDLGKFVALSQRNLSGQFQEIVGRDGAAAQLSFLLDWTQFHTYKIVRPSYGGVQVYVDGSNVPSIDYPETGIPQLPDTQFGGTPSLAFGQFSSEGATSSWQFVRGFFSRGYEISFIKNESTNDLAAELFANQAIVVADVTDEDP